MGPKGGDNGCWCMWNRQTSREFGELHGDKNKGLMRQLVDGGAETGLIGYREGEPVGWVSVAPRQDYGRLQRSRVTKPLDDRPVWSITCFVVPKQHRRSGVASELLEAAVGYVREQGGTLVEGYPVEPRTDDYADFWAWMGLGSMFATAGFDEVARRSETRPFMRRELD